MDKIIFNCCLGLVGIGFGFVGIIFEKQAICWLLFSLSILFACLSIVANYYSSWCSVEDIKKANIILDRKYKEKQDIYEEIKTPYSCWIGGLNNAAMFCLIIGILLFFIFVYVNITQKPNNIKENTMQNITISCEGSERNNPTAPKSTPKSDISQVKNGAERNKPTASKDNTNNSTGKK